MKPFCLAAVAVLSVSICSYAQDAKSTVVSICELSNGWKVHHGQEVTFDAIYSEEKVQAKLQDTTCPEVRVAVEWPSQIPAKMKPPLAKLDALVARDRRKSAWIVVRGVFYGPVLYSEGDIPSNLPSKMQEQMRQSHRRYGYMSGYDYLLKVTEVVKTEPVPEPSSNRGRS